jgi:predicted ATPase
MHLLLDGFCEVVKKSNRNNAEKALAVLWYFDHDQPGIAKTAGQLTKMLGDHHIGTPNQTALAEAIRKTKLANEAKSGFSLKPGSRKIIRDWLPDLDGIQPALRAICRSLSGEARGATSKRCAAN